MRFGIFCWRPRQRREPTHGQPRQPDFVVGPHLKAGRLVEALPQYKAPVLAIHAVYPSRQNLSVKVRRMVDWLASAFEVPGWV